MVHNEIRVIPEGIASIRFTLKHPKETLPGFLMLLSKHPLAPIIQAISKKARYTGLSHHCSSCRNDHRRIPWRTQCLYSSSHTPNLPDQKPINGRMFHLCFFAKEW